MQGSGPRAPAVLIVMAEQLARLQDPLGHGAAVEEHFG